MLQKICNKLYPTFIKSLGIFSQLDRGIYDKVQYSKYGKHPYSFLGNLLCGESCFIMKYLLEKNGCNVKVYRNYTKCSSRIEKDHVFLKVDETIIDPTYRQFMVCICNREKLFLEKPPIMVSDNIEKDIGELVDEERYNDIKINWTGMEDVSSKFNLGEYVKDDKMLIGKPTYYRQLVNSVR